MNNTNVELKELSLRLAVKGVKADTPEILFVKRLLAFTPKPACGLITTLTPLTPDFP